MSDSLKDIKAKVESPKEQSISLYEKSRKLYPRDVRGIFAKWRLLFLFGTQLFYLGMPWVTWNGRQALLFDLVNRKFYLFGLTIWPQDFVYLSALLMCCAFGLFLWTTIAGRLWCGYACPQTVYTEVMLWIERLVEGDHIKRQKLDKQAMNGRKFVTKTIKHGIMIVFSLWTGFTLVGYYTPIRDLVAAAPTFNYGPWETFWIFFYAGFTYLFAAHMREQVCKYMCPYARFQSVMFDRDTLIISYDEARGEPRGARKKGIDPKDAGLGSCINCGICVQVCPVGIDIRDGLQYECIGCAACIDACDEVMDKMGYPRGLISYTTENVQEGKFTRDQIKQRILRPRVIMYSLVLLVVITTAATAFFLRLPFKVDIIRDRASLVRETDDGWLENSYSIRIMNVTDQPQRFTLTVDGMPDLRLQADEKEILVRPGDNRLVGVRVQAQPEVATKGSHEIHFTISRADDPSLKTREKSSFIGE
ncbi:cytochrome c oxidase accessory protein CcoG [Paludibacterium sp. B53371]|uniref:cytochrome c oxidase accessory protein CcoG n=1 Tax=Paludibacterium sp. B53371 TaxID=2806263 RepID=UPI001C0424D2|nr:cytochrome c oxidase accessory protein CcoG [Paludibacterium sp. B53371]